MRVEDLSAYAPGQYQITVPLYLPFLAFVLVAGVLFYRDRQSGARMSGCAACGYDLSGVAGKCPECGKEAPAR